MEADGSIIDLLKSFATWASLAFASLIAWLGKRLVKRVDDIEKKYTSKDTFNETLKSLREDNKEFGARMTRSFDRLSDDVKGTNTRIDRVLEKKAGLG